MKFQLSFVLAIAATPVALARGAGEPPSSEDIPYTCNWHPRSPSHETVKAGIETMRNWEDKEQMCSASSDGSSARMAAGDGYSFYIVSLDPENVTSHKCTSDIPEALKRITIACVDTSTDRVLSEGSAWVPGEEGNTYVYVTGESK